MGFQGLFAYSKLTFFKKNFSDPMSTTFVTGANFVDDNATMTLTLLQDPQAMSTPVIGERTTRFSRRLSTAHKNDENTTMHVFSNVETETVSGTIPQQQGMQHRSQVSIISCVVNVVVLKCLGNLRTPFWKFVRTQM